MNLPKNKFIRLPNGRFNGSLGEGKKGISSVSKIKKTLSQLIGSDKRHEEQYEKINQKYEKWVNSLLDIEPNNKYPNQTYAYKRLVNGNHCISLSVDKTREWTMLGEHSQLGVGSLIWHHSTGEIIGIGVEKEYQRKGIASELYRLALGLSASSAKLARPIHATARTPAGQAWAEAVGGEIPKENGFTTPEYWNMSERP